jgi:hypothetical protein
LRSRKCTVKVYIQVILHHRSCVCCVKGGGGGVKNVPLLLQALDSSTRYLAEDTRSKSRVFSRSNKLQRRCHVTNDLLHHEGIRAGDTRSEFALIALHSWASNEEARLPGASSFVEKVSPCRRLSASVGERKREVRCKFEMKCCCPALESGRTRLRTRASLNGSDLLFFPLTYTLILRCIAKNRNTTGWMSGRACR